MRALSFASFLIAMTAIAGTTAGPAHADPEKPPAAAVAAYEAGQSYERLFQDINLSPATCGIVLERAQCMGDLQAIAGMRESDATDLQVQRWFATGDIALRVQNWNDMYVPDKAWTENPVFAWWYTAGIVSIAASLPRGSPLDEYLGHYADELVKHASAAPDNSSKWVPSGGNPVAALASMQSSLQQVFPVVPYPHAAFVTGAAAYAQLGVYVSTLQQLVDNPPALSRPASQAFAAVVAARLQELHARFSDGLTAAPLQKAINQPITLDPHWIDATWRRPLSEQVNTHWPEEARSAFVTGGLVAQVAYNAAILKDPNADGSFRSIIAALPAWQGMSSKIQADITALKGVPYASKGGTWGNINSAATTAVLDIANER